MSSRLVLRQTIAALLHAGKTPTVIARELQCAKSTVYKVKNLKEAGKDLKPTYKTRKSPVNTARRRAAVLWRARGAPTTSLTKLASDSGTSRRSVARILKESGGRSLRRSKVPLISADGRERRASRALGLINALKSFPPGQIIFFSDEKKNCGGSCLKSSE